MPNRIGVSRLLAAGALLAAAALAQAGGLPAPYELLQTQTQHSTFGGLAGQTSGGPGSLGISVASHDSATATLSLGPGGLPPDPTLTATVQTFAGGSQPYVEATAKLVYAAEVTGPAGGSANVNISFTEHVCCRYGVTVATAGYNIIEAAPGSAVTIDPASGQYGIMPGYPAAYSILSNGQYGMLSSVNSPIETGATVVNQTLYGIPVGTIFLLALSVDAAVDPAISTCCGFPPPALLKAQIDPAITITASTPNAAAFGLLYSPGILPVPEPAPAATLVLALPLLLLLRRRRDCAASVTG